MPRGSARPVRHSPAGNSRPLFLATERQVRTIEEQGLAPWHRPPGDDLFGIQAIADYLGLPFLDVRTLLGLERLPVWKTSSAHTTARTALVAHFLDLERRYVAETLAAPPPADIRPNDSLGLIKGAPAISHHLGCSQTAVKKWRRAHALPLFRLGKHWLARRDTVDRWRELVADDTPSERRRRSLLEKRTGAAPAGAIVGAAAIAAVLGIPEAAAFKGIYRGKIPAFRVGKGWVADHAALIELKANMERNKRNGERS